MAKGFTEGDKIGFDEAWQLPAGAVVKVNSIAYVIVDKAQYPPPQHEKDPRQVITLRAHGQDVPNQVYATASWHGWGKARFVARSASELNGRFG